MNCPNCGAPMESSESSCKYCMKQNKLYIDNMEIRDFAVENVGDMVKDTFLTNCLKCGAPLKTELNGKCEYCGVTNNMDRTEWVLTNVEDVKTLPYEEK